MSYQSQSELGPEAGGWLHEPCWAAEAQSKKASWRDEDLALESFVSGHSPYEIRENEPHTPMAEEIGSASQNYPSRSIAGRGVNATSTTRQSKSTGSPAAKNVSGDIPHRPSSIPSHANLPEAVRSAASSQEYFPVTSSASPVIITSPTSPMETSQTSFERHNENPADMDLTDEDDNSLRTEGQYHGAENQSVAWHEVRSLREEILILRSQVREKRAGLRRMEAAKAEADNLLFKRMVNSIHLGENALPGIGQKTLHELMEDCQTARNAHGPEEHECTVLEDRLSRLEFKLNRLEKPFFSQVEQPRPPLMLVDSATGPVLASHGTNTWSIANDDFDEPNYHPLVTKFLSKQGDLDLLHERRDNLLDEKHSLEEEKESRSRFGMTLNDDDQAWLDGSQAEHDSLAKDIDTLEKELAELKLYCVSQGLVDEDGEPTKFEALEEASFQGEEGLNSEAQMSEYVKHPILLPLHSSRNHEDFKKYEPKPDETSDLRTTRINDWMLKSLRISPLEVNFLARTYESGGKEAGTQWEIAVLRFWFTDVKLGLPLGNGRARASSLITETDDSNHSKQNYPKDDNDYSFVTSFFLGRTFLSDQSFDTELLFPLTHSPPPLWSEISWKSI